MSELYGKQHRCVKGAMKVGEGKAGISSRQFMEEGRVDNVITHEQVRMSSSHPLTWYALYLFTMLFSANYYDSKVFNLVNFSEFYTSLFWVFSLSSRFCNGGPLDCVYNDNFLVLGCNIWCMGIVGLRVLNT